MRRRAANAAVVILALVAGASGCGKAPESPPADRRPPRPFTLALDFAPNAAHAGVYGARAAGTDRARGLSLRLRAPTASTDSLKLLASGRADMSIADIHDLGLARERGDDLVGVGALVQRPLAAVIARPPVRRPRDLEGRRVGVAGLPSDDAVVRAVVEADGGRVERIRRTTIGFSAVPALVSGRVAAATAFWNAEGVALRQRGVPTREFRLGERAGVRYPELVLVVRRELLERERPRVAAAVGALAAGTEIALRDPQPALEEIARASSARPRDVEAQFGAVRPALSPPVRLNRRALEAWAAFDQRYGILRERPYLGRAFDLSIAGTRRAP
ncbi:MAG TPA: ABC transporter substrate-binding protein [Thermoleophilaceae bacterium]|nr:ABC transporter substrate-binding protein [Thermoleophilaceae bacterium]